jgi:hypothetical protein
MVLDPNKIVSSNIFNMTTNSQGLPPLVHHNSNTQRMSSSTSSSSSSSSSSLKTTANTLAHQVAREKNKAIEELKRLAKNMLPRPNGTTFMIHGTDKEPIEPQNVRSGNQRSYSLSVAQAVQRIPKIERPVDTFGLARQQRRDVKSNGEVSRTPWTAKSATQAMSVLLRCFKSIVFVIPELHCFDLLAQFALTSYRPPGALPFVPAGVRMCCPVCQSNKYVAYDRVRALPLHGFGSKRLVVDWQCSCCSPNCPAVKSKVFEYNNNKKNKKNPISINIKKEVKSVNCHYSFCTSDLRLIQLLLPPEVGFMLDVCNRGRSSLTGELRRALITFDDDATLHKRLQRRFDEQYLYKILPGYINFINSEVLQDEKHLFGAPTIGSTDCLNSNTLGAIQDEFWKNGDSEVVKREIQKHTTGKVVKADGTWEVVRCLAGDQLCYVIVNEVGLIIFIGTAPSEAKNNILLAHCILAARNHRRGLDQPLGGCSDVCCHGSPVHVSAMMEAYGYTVIDKIDCFHGVQRLSGTLVSANKTNVKAERDAMLVMFHCIIWKSRREKYALARLYNENSHLSHEELVNLKGVDITSRCEMGLINDLLRDNKFKGKDINNSLQAILLIRKEKKTFDPYVIEERNTIAQQELECQKVIDMLEKEIRSPYEERLKSVTTNFKDRVQQGTIKQLFN